MMKEETRPKVSEEEVVTTVNKYRKNLLHGPTPNVQSSLIKDYSSTEMVVNVINEVKQTEKEKETK